MRKYLESEGGSDLLGEMVKMAAELLMAADVDVLCDAGYGERTEDRVNSRNGHRDRRWDTRAGTIDLEVPKLRQGSYLPVAPRAPPAGGAGARRVVCQAYVRGGVDPAGSTTWSSHGDRRDLQVPGRRTGESLDAGGRVPQPAARCRAVHLRLAGRARAPRGAM